MSDGSGPCAVKDTALHSGAVGVRVSAAVDEVSDLAHDGCH